MVEEERHEAEAIGVLGSLLAPLGMAFWRVKSSFEREVGVSLGVMISLEVLVREDGLSQGELGRKFEIDPSRITRLAQRLEREGWIRRERDAEDSRIVRMYITDEGRVFRDELRERYEGFRDRLEHSLADEDLEQLEESLGRVAEAMKDYGRDN